MTLRKRIVGTAGHIDHGKTTLVRSLTGIDCDRLPEEKRRGITIDLGFASWITGDLQIGFIDVPGHERFVKNMLAGAGGIDAVLLVVAADESIKPQTREHFAICKLLGIQTGVIAITKIDAADPQLVELVRLEIEEMVAGSFLEARAIVAVSARSGEGLAELEKELVAACQAIADRDSDRKVFRLPVDRAFTLKGFGSVVTGTTVSGSLDAGETIVVLPEGLPSRARQLHVHGETRQRALSGERTSVNLADLAIDSLRRGQQLAREGTLSSSQVLTVEIELLDGVKPLKNQSRIRFHHYTAELLGSVRFLVDTAELAPGAKAFAQVRLESPAVAVAGDRFVLRRYSPSVTIGGGVIVDPLLDKFRRSTRAEVLAELAGRDPADRLALLARLHGLRGVSIHELQARTGIRANILADEFARKPVPAVVAVEERVFWLHQDALAAFRHSAMEFLTSWFSKNKLTTGIAKSEFVQKLLRGVEEPVTGFLLRDLEREKIIRVADDTIELPGRSKDLTGAEGELSRLIERRFLETGLQPPPISELIQTIPQRPKVIEGIVAFLSKQGVIHRLADGLYVHRDSLVQARAKLEEHRGKTLDIAAFKDLFGLSRKVAIPLLEFFDRSGVTKRVGDRREVL